MTPILICFDFMYTLLLLLKKIACYYIFTYFWHKLCPLKKKLKKRAKVKRVGFVISFYELWIFRKYFRLLYYIIGSISSGLILRNNTYSLCSTLNVSLFIHM